MISELKGNLKSFLILQNVVIANLCKEDSAEYQYLEKIYNNWIDYLDKGSLEQAAVIKQLLDSCLIKGKL